jgi:malate dehydrogenase (oxaloacetate-decarboxylating)(NADP+)
MVEVHGDNPIIFAMANPDPEITPEEVAERPLRRHRGDRAFGLSEPGQQRARLSLYLPRRARCARHRDQRRDEDRRRHALAELAREDVPDDVAAAYAGNRPKFGPGYIIPVPFDPRLISAIPVAVAKAAIETGVAAREIVDFDEYPTSFRRGAIRSPRHCSASTSVSAVIRSASSSPKARRNR